MCLYCVAECVDLQAPNDGAVKVTNDTDVAMATYTCNPGYEMIEGDTSTRTCLPTAEWSGSEPVCARMLLQYLFTA